MSTAGEQAAPQPHPQIVEKGLIASFFDTLIGTVMLFLLTAGLITITLTWRASDIEFLTDGRVKVTKASWWGLQKKVHELEFSSQDGWAEIDEVDGNEERSLLRHRSMRLEN